MFVNTTSFQRDLVIESKEVQKTLEPVRSRHRASITPVGDDDISAENVARHPEAPRIDHINRVESRVRDSGRRFLRHILPASCSLSVLWSNIMAIEFLQL